MPHADSEHDGILEVDLEEGKDATHPHAGSSRFTRTGDQFASMHCPQIVMLTPQLGSTGTCSWSGTLDVRWA